MVRLARCPAPVEIDGLDAHLAFDLGAVDLAGKGLGLHGAVRGKHLHRVERWIGAIGRVCAKHACSRNARYPPLNNLRQDLDALQLTFARQNHSQGAISRAVAQRLLTDRNPMALNHDGEEIVSAQAGATFLLCQIGTF